MTGDRDSGPRQVGSCSKPACQAAITALLVVTGALMSCQAERIQNSPWTTGVDSAALRAKLGNFLGMSLNTVKVSGNDTIVYSPSSYHCSQNCESVSPNTGNVTVVLPRRATTVSVTSFGPFKCSGTLPVLRAYDMSGTLLATSTMVITDPPDCAAGNDDMSNKLNGGVTHASGTIAFVTISPPAPWTWPVRDCCGGTLTARALIDYTVSIPVGGQPGPLACPPTGDSLLDSQAVRDSLVAILQRSNPDSAPGSGHKVERGGAIWQRPDGTRFATEVGPPLALQSECTYELANPAGIPAPEPGVFVVAGFHTHPQLTNEQAYGCQAPPGQPPFAQSPADPFPPARVDPDGTAAEVSRTGGRQQVGTFLSIRSTRVGGSTGWIPTFRSFSGRRTRIGGNGTMVLHI